MALHEQSIGATDEWFTPPYIFDAMSVRFDVDVAHPGAGFAQWVPADRYVTSDSLAQTWEGFVWMNPPFGARNGLAPWLDKFFRHGNGVALVPDRTSAPWWQTYAPLADLTLFVAPKIKFIGRDGAEGKSPAQGTALFAKGEQGVLALKNAKTLGRLFIPYKETA